MVKILSVFGILLALFPNVAYCNNSSDDKKLIVSGMKAFKQKKANKLIKLRTSSLNEEINHWLDFWLIKLKIEKNPFDKKIRADLKNFSKKKVIGIEPCSNVEKITKKLRLNLLFIFSK